MSSYLERNSFSTARTLASFTLKKNKRQEMIRMLTDIAVRTIGLIVLVGLVDRIHAADATQAAAIAAIEKVGGAVRPMSNRNSQEWVVEFHLRGRMLTDEGLAHVAALKNVVSLNLRDTKITGAGLVHLKGLMKLRRLHLDRTDVGDNGMENLAGLIHLEYLNLYGTNITDKSLEHLIGLKRLESLYVWQTGVTDVGVTRLAEELPDLRIVRGVDLSKLPTLEESVAKKPDPKVNLKWMAVNAAFEAPKSTGGGLNTQVIFENNSKRLVKLYWVGFGNELKLYAELRPGAKRQQNSYSKHTWLVTDENDTPLGYFMVAEEVCRAVIPAG